MKLCTEPGVLAGRTRCVACFGDGLLDGCAYQTSPAIPPGVDSEIPQARTARHVGGVLEAVGVSRRGGQPVEDQEPNKGTGFTPFPRTVGLRVAPSVEPLHVIVCVWGCETARCNQKYPLLVSARVWYQLK